MRVVVTGATGFIGRHCLAPLRDRGCEVHALTSRAATGAEDGVTWHRADLFDGARVERLMMDLRPHALLHLAWYAEPGRYWRSLENYRWVEASLGLVRAFRDSGGARVVGAGTCAEYDWSAGYLREERTPLAPATPYGACKRATSDLLASFGAETALSCGWGRIFFLYGPHEHPRRLVSSVVTALLRGEPARCSHGEQIRDLLHVQDVADALVALLASRVEGPVNIASGRPVILREVVGTIATRIGRPELVELGAVPAAAGEPPVLLADVSRLRDEVGWTPRIGLPEGLEQTIGWWRERARA